jgi:UDP-N-acetylglucosamine--dolichyl-phosphate N-acetylglucosaminephosphotransferase
MMLWVVIASVLAFLVTYATTPLLIRKLKALEIVGVDVHKATRPICAEMGGLSVLLGATSAFCLTFFLPSLPSLTMLGAFSTIVLAGVVGVIDDLFTLRQRHKVFLVALTAIPLLLVKPGYTDIWFPFVGSIPLGFALPLLIPLCVATSSNLTNMFAGFNGLESGIGVIAMFALGILSITLGKWEASLLAFPLSAAYLAFLRFNWYPAKIFPGDTGTLLSGAALATISIMAGIEAAGIIILAPAGIDFTLKMISKHPFAHRRIYGDTEVTGNGKLVPPPYPALCHAFMTLTPLNEKDLVTALLFMEAVYSTIAVFLFKLF